VARPWQDEPSPRVDVRHLERSDARFCRVEASAFILSRLYSVLQCSAPLQCVQNAAAPLELEKTFDARDHVRPAPRELHWLPLAHRIKFKVVLLIYMAHNRLCPLYISEVLTPVSSTSMHRQLRSSGSSNYTIPRTRTKFCDTAFSVAGPVVWNSISESISAANNVHTFKHLLKTHFSTFLTDLINSTVTMLLF